jgi:hypothetical protein
MASGKDDTERGNEAGDSKQNPSDRKPDDLVLADQAPGLQPVVSAQCGNDSAKNQGNREGNRPEIGEGRSLELERRHLAVQQTLAFFAAIALVVGFFQLRTMVAQNEVMISQNKIMIAERRPWVSINATVPIAPEVGLPLNVNIELKKSGPTPARIVKHGFKLVYFVPGEPVTGVGRLDVVGIDRDVILENEMRKKMLADAKESGDRFVVPPDDAVSYGAKRTRNLDQELLDDINESMIIPVFVTFVVYTDATGRDRTTWYCGVYNKDKRIFTRTARYNDMN